MSCRVLTVECPGSNKPGYVLSPGDTPAESVWKLIREQMGTALTNTKNNNDVISLRYPVTCHETVIAPDLLAAAEEAGMGRDDFDEDVAKFLEGVTQ